MAGTLIEMARTHRRILALALAAAACAVPLAAQPGPDVTETSRPVRLLRSWQETVKLPDGTETPRRVDVIIDYRKGFASEIFSTPDGKWLGRMSLGAGQPTPSQVEISEAFRIVRDDPQFELIFRRFQPVLEGGFILLERRGQPCGPGSRCLRVFVLSSDRAGTIRQVVVDLVKQSVVHPDYIVEPWSAR